MIRECIVLLCSIMQLVVATTGMTSYNPVPFTNANVNFTVNYDVDCLMDPETKPHRPPCRSNSKPLVIYFLLDSSDSVGSQRWPETVSWLNLAVRQTYHHMKVFSLQQKIAVVVLQVSTNVILEWADYYSDDPATVKAWDDMIKYLEQHPEDAHTNLEKGLTTIEQNVRTATTAGSFGFTINNGNTKYNPSMRLKDYDYRPTVTVTDQNYQDIFQKLYGGHAVCEPPSSTHTISGKVSADTALFVVYDGEYVHDLTKTAIPTDQTFTYTTLVLHNTKSQLSVEAEAVKKLSKNRVMLYMREVTHQITSYFIRSLTRFPYPSAPAGWTTMSTWLDPRICEYRLVILLDNVNCDCIDGMLRKDYEAQFALVKEQMKLFVTGYIAKSRRNYFDTISISIIDHNSERTITHLGVDDVNPEWSFQIDALKLVEGDAEAAQSVNRAGAFSKAIKILNTPSGLETNVASRHILAITNQELCDEDVGIDLPANKFADINVVWADYSRDVRTKQVEKLPTDNFDNTMPVPLTQVAIGKPTTNDNAVGRLLVLISIPDCWQSHLLKYHPRGCEATQTDHSADDAEAPRGPCGPMGIMGDWGEDGRPGDDGEDNYECTDQFSYYNVNKNGANTCSSDSDCVLPADQVNSLWTQTNLGYTPRSVQGVCQTTLRGWNRCTYCVEETAPLSNKFTAYNDPDQAGPRCLHPPCTDSELKCCMGPPGLDGVIGNDGDIAPCEDECPPPLREYIKDNNGQPTATYYCNRGPDGSTGPKGQVGPRGPDGTPNYYLQSILWRIYIKLTIHNRNCPADCPPYKPCPYGDCPYGVCPGREYECPLV